MENVTVSLLLFFAKASLVSAVIGYLVYLKTRSTITAAVNGFIAPFCVLTFFFLISQMEIGAALLTMVLSFVILLLLFIIACVFSPRLQARIQREMKAQGAADPLF